MSYYDTFLATTNFPKEHFKKNFQAVVDSGFKNATTFNDDIYEEIEFGTLEFKRIEARITTIIDPRTGDRISDDFREIMFQNLDYQPPLGTRYKFDDNIWITYATDNIRTDASTLYIRRCNNTLGIQDVYGNVHREPCYIDYKPTKTSVLDYYTMTTPYTKQVVYCQLNKYTSNIEINDRFIFGRDAYKVSDRIKFNKLNTFDTEGAKMLRMYVDYDNLNEYDNRELEVADYFLPNYKIEIQSELIGLINDTGTLNYKVRLDGQEVEEALCWYTSDENIVSIDKTTGVYKLLRAGEATISCKLKNNETDFQYNIMVKALEVVEQIMDNKIIPEISRIPLNQSQTYEVFETINGQNTSTTFDIVFSNAPSKNYKYAVQDNSFTIQNLKTSDVLLKVVCTNRSTLEQIEKYIELGGIF